MQRRHFVGALAASLAAPAIPGSVLALDGRPRRGADPIRLSSNENPLGMPDSARRAVIEALEIGNRYPQRRDELQAAVAAHHSVASSAIVLGNGSTEVLQMVVQAMGAGARLILPDPTFEHVEQYARPFGITIVKVPLRPDGSHDLDRMREAAAGGPALVFICNPNNPTATLTSCDDVEAWIRAADERTWFLVDEAYFDFVEAAGYRTFIPLAMSRPNTVVSRTFSKVYGLAGVRVGYALAEPGTARAIEQFTLNTNLNQLGIAAALAALGERDYVARSLRVNRESRDLALATLRELGIEHLPTHTNFLMHRIRGELGSYIAAMAARGIRVGRPFPPMLDHNRVSFGLPEEMEAWGAALRELRAAGLA